MLEGALRPYRVGEECTDEVRELIDLCMRTNVNERPSAMEIVTRLQVRMLALPAYSCTKSLSNSFVLRGAIGCC